MIFGSLVLFFCSCKDKHSCGNVQDPSSGGLAWRSFELSEHQGEVFDDLKLLFELDSDLDVLKAAGLVDLSWEQVDCLKVSTTLKVKCSPEKVTLVKSFIRKALTDEALQDSRDVLEYSF